MEITRVVTTNQQDVAVDIHNSFRVSVDRQAAVAAGGGAPRRWEADTTRLFHTGQADAAAEEVNVVTINIHTNNNVAHITVKLYKLNV